MKKPFVKLLSLVLVVVMLASCLIACKKQLSGSFQHEIVIPEQTWRVTYTFKESKVDALGELIIGNKVTTYEATGTYEISDDETGKLYIAFDFETENNIFRDGMYDFEEGEDYIVIISSKYKKN